MKALKNLFIDRTWLGSLFRISLLVTLLTIPFWYHYRVVHIQGVSMTPTYHDGQWSLMQRARSLDDSWIPERFDVIVIWSDKHKTTLIKRVIGLPGETVEIREGIIYINDKKLYDIYGEGKVIYRILTDPETGEPWWSEYQNVPPKAIASNYVWVIGDFREASIFGHFPISNIRGEIVLE